MFLSSHRRVCTKGSSEGPPPPRPAPSRVETAALCYRIEKKRNSKWRRSVGIISASLSCHLNKDRTSAARSCPPAPLWMTMATHFLLRTCLWSLVMMLKTHREAPNGEKCILYSCLLHTDGDEK